MAPNFMNRATSQPSPDSSTVPRIIISRVDGSSDPGARDAQPLELNSDLHEEPLADMEQTHGPFGFQCRSAGESTLRMIEEGLVRGKRWKVHKLKETLRTRIKNTLRQTLAGSGLRSMSAAAANTKRNNVKEGVLFTEEDYAEDPGTRKAVAVTRSWKNVDLLATYVLLIALATYCHLGSALSPMLLNAVAEDLSRPRKSVPSISPLDFELAWAGLVVADIVGILIFAKLSNAYSRPHALLISLSIAFSGLMRVSYYGTKWIDFSVGLVIFSFGKSGVLIILYVMIADMSDLRWRGICSWGLEWGVGVSVWTIPFFWKSVTEITAPSTGRLYFSIGMPLSIAVVLTTYVFLYKAKFRGFIPKVPHSSKRKWWSIIGVGQSLLHTAQKLDIIGMALWALGTGLLLSSSLISFECKIWQWRLVLVLGGGAFTALFTMWELWLNGVAKRATGHKPTGSNDIGRNDMPSGNPRNGLSPVFVASARNPTLGDNLGHWRNPQSFHFGEPNQPLFRARLLKSRSVSVGALIGFLVDFVARIGIYSEGDPVGLLSIGKQGGKLGARVPLQNIAITSKICAGLLAAVLIWKTQRPKYLTVIGLVVVLISIVAICFVTEPGIYEVYRIVPQVLLGIGAGFSWTALLVGVQSSCGRHTDVAIATALLATCSRLGEAAGGIVKRIIKAGIAKYLASDERARIKDPMNSEWVAMIATAVSIAVFNTLLGALGLEDTLINGIKQKVSGVVFGHGDPLPGDSGDDTDPIFQGMGDFHTSTLTSDDRTRQHTQPFRFAAGGVSARGSDALSLSILSNSAIRRQGFETNSDHQLLFREPSQSPQPDWQTLGRGTNGPVFSDKHAQSKARVDCNKHHNGMSPGVSTVFGGGRPHAPKLELDTESAASIFIDDGIRSGEGAGNGVSGTMEVVDGGYFSYNGSELVRKLRKLRKRPSGLGTHTRASEEKTQTPPPGEDSTSKDESTQSERGDRDGYLGFCNQSPKSMRLVSTFRIATEAERLSRKNTYVIPEVLSPICESVSGMSGSLPGQSKASSESKDSSESGRTGSSRRYSNLYKNVNMSDMDRVVSPTDGGNEKSSEAPSKSA